MPPWRGSLKRDLLQRLHLLSRFSNPPHTAKRDISNGVCGRLSLDTLHQLTLPPLPSGGRARDVTLTQIGEHALLGRIRNRVSRPPADVLVGIGDDAAVVTLLRNEQTVLTTDALVEGVHFDRRWSTPADVGYKALAVNLSDLAAMGATPRWVLLSLVLPDLWSVEDVDALLDGLLALADRERVSLIGGNVTRTTGPAMVDVTAIGSVRPRRVLLRSGGRPGDEVYVSGVLGASSAGLEMLRAGVSGSDEDTAACVAHHRRPEARVRLGRALAQTRAARAAMDLSDGLADAARQIAIASGCGVTINADAVPIAPGARRWWEAAGRDAVACAIRGGDDYELLIALPRSWHGRLRHARRQVAAPALTRIATLTKDPALVIERDGRREELVGGYEHFRG
jgi:thiamine-monophosphate kinase